MVDFREESEATKAYSILLFSSTNIRAMGSLVLAKYKRT
jgi:hypothetical protein